MVVNCGSVVNGSLVESWLGRMCVMRFRSPVQVQWKATCTKRIIQSTSHIFILFPAILLKIAFKGDWNAKVRSQEIPRVTGKFGLGVQKEAEQRLTEFCQENTLVIVNTHFQQHKGWCYRWESPDGQHQNQIAYILCSRKWRSSIQSAKTIQGADCGSDHEPLIAKFRLKLKKVGETTRPFWYDLNKIPYNYTVEVTNRFKGLDWIDRVPKELWTEVCGIVQEAVIKTIPQGEIKRQNGYLRRLTNS